MKTTIKIESIFGKLLFEHKAEDNTIKKTLEEAVKSGADLRGAYLGGANLGGADLGGADLGNADLRGADLGNADLRGTNLGGANLGGAYLRGTNLGGANLGGAYLRGTNLGGAYLGGANLRGTNLGGAYLGGAYLGDADLRGADLRGAYLGGEWGKLESSSDILIVGPIGSRNGYTTLYHTDKGVFVACGCFRGTLDEFAKKVEGTHGDNNHARDYKALIEFVKVKYGV